MSLSRAKERLAELEPELRCTQGQVWSILDKACAPDGSQYVEADLKAPTICCSETS